MGLKVNGRSRFFDFRNYHRSGGKIIFNFIWKKKVILLYNFNCETKLDILFEERRMVMFCKKCGNEVSENSTYCDKCGERLDGKQITSINNISFSFDVKQINIFGVVASLITIISVFLPCISITLFGVSVSINYIQGDGQIVLIIGIIALILALMGKRIFLTVIGIVDFLIFLYLNHNLSNQYLNILSKGIGYYLLPIGAILMILSGMVNFNIKSDDKINPHINNINSVIDNAKERIINFINSNIKLNKKIVKKGIISIIILIVLIVIINFVLNINNPGHFVKTNNETHYKFKSGDLAKSEWIKHNGEEYYFNENGILQKKKWVDTNYYVDADGKKKKNSFIEDGSKKYYLKSDGKYAKSELITVNGKTYAFDDNGANMKSKTYENASPSYICYVNNDGYVEKKKGLNTIGKDSIYVLDGNTGALLKSDWHKDEKTNKYMYFDGKGLMAKDRLIVGLVTDDGDTLYLNDYHKDLSKSKDNLLLSNTIASLGVPKYYYVDKDGYMVTNDDKDIDGYMWKFDGSGYGTKQLWKQSNYSDSSKNYIINKKYYTGIYTNTLSDNSKPGYLEICVDNDDVSLFLYEGESKRQVKNTLTYSNKDFNLRMQSKSIPNNYRFTGTMYKKSDRIFIDNSSAETTIKNLLLSGEEFLLVVSEDDSYWDDTYYFLIDAGDFQNIYNKTFAK